MDWLGARPSAGASVESQALAGVIMIIAGYLTPVSYTHLTLPTNREV